MRVGFQRYRYPYTIVCYRNEIQFICTYANKYLNHRKESSLASYADR